MDVQVYAESKERMAWVSCLLSILDSANHLDTQDRVRVLIQAGLDLLLGWEKEPTRPEFIQLAHRWTSIIACADSHQDIELFWMHIGNDSGESRTVYGVQWFLLKSCGVCPGTIAPDNGWRSWA